ncbi:MAG: hypothetical protein ACLFRT_10950 [Actinomycetota bacterium]
MTLERPPVYNWDSLSLQDAGEVFADGPFHSGTDAHYDSMKRRSYVESSYGNIKSEAKQNLRRPSLRVMGRAKMTLIAAFVSAAANLRMGRLWTRRRNQANGGGPASATIRAAARAQKRAEARRRRKAERREETKLESSPSPRARSRPPPG